MPDHQRVAERCEDRASSSVTLGQGMVDSVPRDLQERAPAVSRHAERLGAQLGRSPTVDELADALDCTLEQTVEAINAAESYQLASLDASGVHEDEDSGVLAETWGTRTTGSSSPRSDTRW